MSSDIPPWSGQNAGGNAHPHSHLHPSPWAYYHQYNWRWSRPRGPHRFLWFAIGAGAATIFIRSKEHWRNQEDHFKRLSKAIEERHNAPSFTSPIPTTPSFPNSFEDEVEKAKRYRHQASSTVAELTDASLDSILSAVAALKMRLKDAEERVHQQNSTSAAEEPNREESRKLV